MQSDNTQLKILHVLQELCRDLSNIKTNSLNTQNQQETSHSIRKYMRKSPGTGGCFRKNITKYCWTHGACAHAIEDCPDKAKGHQKMATFKNKMKRSKTRCE